MGIKHLAVSAATESKELDKLFLALKTLAEMQIKKDITILTVGLPKLPEDKLVEFFKFYLRKEHLNKNKVKLGVIGKWYDLPSKLLELIKEMMNDTREYDKFFLNFAINYDGQEEIVDSCKLLCRQVSAGKTDFQKITKNSIKENLYASYFMPPEIIIITGKEKKWNGFLLWDSVGANILFTGADFEDLKIEEIK